MTNFLQIITRAHLYAKYCKETPGTRFIYFIYSLKTLKIANTDQKNSPYIYTPLINPANSELYFFCQTNEVITPILPKIRPQL